MRNKILLVGLDGATFKILDPLLEAGNLPNIQNIIESGVRGILQSTFPPVTGPAWTALATGKNPGKTGVFDTLQANSQAIRKANPYWDYLSKHGLRVGIANYPFLYPPYAVNGIMLSGFGSNPRDEIAYPKEFKRILIEKCGQYRIQPPLVASKYVKNPSLFVKHILGLLEINKKTLELFLESDLDLLTFIISVSDFVQHEMWKYIDPTHPFYNKDMAQRYEPIFVQIWKIIDEIVGFAVKALPYNTNVIIVSDHGFGPHRSTFYTNSWLEEEGYLFKRKGILRARRIETTAVQLIRSVSPYLYAKLIKSAAISRIPKLSAKDELDWGKTLAYSPVNASLVGEICINKEAPLIKDDNMGFKNLREQIVHKLEGTCRNIGVQVNVFYPQELYTGQYVNMAPDIFFELELGACEIRCGFGETIFCTPPTEKVRSGSHRKEGVIIACGPDIMQGQRIEGAKIYDIAPTILYLAGLSVPDDMDGKILMDILRDASAPAFRGVSYLTGAKDAIKVRVKKLREHDRI